MRLTLPAGLLLLVSTLLAGCGGSSNSGGTTPGPVATTTTLSASPNPAISGQTVTLTATVTASSGTPTGAVAFFNGTTSLGAGTLANGVATLALATLPTGADSLTANYPGTAGFQTSTSAAFAEVINAAPVATTTALTASPTTADIGQSVTLTATVKKTSGSGTPTGKLSFTVEGETLYTGSLNGSGVLTLTTSTNGLAPGTYPVVASYAGDSGDEASKSSAVNVTLDKAPTTTTVTASPNPVTRPASITLTATVVRSASKSTGTPTGKVTFTADGETLDTISLNSSGVATLTAPTGSYGAGTYSVVVKYVGDDFDTASNSTALSVTLK